MMIKLKDFYSLNQYYDNMNMWFRISITFIIITPIIMVNKGEFWKQAAIISCIIALYRISYFTYVYSGKR